MRLGDGEEPQAPTYTKLQTEKSQATASSSSVAASSSPVVAGQRCKALVLQKNEGTRQQFHSNYEPRKPSNLTSRNVLLPWQFALGLQQLPSNLLYEGTRNQNCVWRYIVFKEWRQSFGWASTRRSALRLCACVYTWRGGLSGSGVVLRMVGSDSILVQHLLV